MLALLLVLSAGCADEPAPDAGLAKRPNILLIVVDDMGFSDLGSFGGEIETPNLDRLAYAGIRFTNFHASMMCSPSRAMLMTGVDNHLTGFGNMLEELAPNQKGQPGYEGRLNDRVVTVASLLRDTGYRTYITGKWHLGTGGSGPAKRGFARSFVLASGGASHFSDMRPAYAPSPDIKANYWEDGVKLATLPPEYEYSSQYYVDRMMEFFSEGDNSDQPFFAFLSFTAPHWPLQAPAEAIAAQSGRYDDGYDAVASRRLERMKDMTLVPQNAVRSERSPKEVPWEQLDEEDRRVEVRAMEVYAAMINQVDLHAGRLLDYMRDNALLDDTVVIFLSDNGPEGHDLDETWPMEAFPEIRKTIDAGHDFSYENMGHPGSYTLYGPNWANAGSPSFRLHKAFPTEGGTRVAAFVHYPPIVEKAVVADDFVSISDVTPTILELAGVEHPNNRYAGRPIEPMTGRSLVPLLKGEGAGDGERITGIELLGKRAIRSGDWKLVHMPSPYGIDDWQLFDLKRDPSERDDVANEHPELVTEMIAHWEDYAKRNNVIIPDWVSGY